MLRRFKAPRGVADAKEIITPRLVMRGVRLDKTDPPYRDWVDIPDKTLTHWTITAKKTGERIGNAGVINHDIRNRRCEIGYCLKEPFWGRGLMTEAAKALSHHLLFDIGYNRIEARHSPCNPASGAVLRKIGMTYEGLARQRRLILKGSQGCYEDRLIFSLLFDDVFPSPPVSLQSFDTLSDGEIDVVCGSITDAPKGTGCVPTYDCDIRLHGSGETVGALRLSVGFSDNIYYGGHIGYHILDQYRGHHFAAKSCILIKPLALSLGIRPLILTSDPDNIPSGKTLLRIGAKCVRMVEVPAAISDYLSGGDIKLIFEWW